MNSAQLQRALRGIALLSTYLLIMAPAIMAPAGMAQSLPNRLLIPNAQGLLETFNIAGPIDLTGPFFQSLGSNGRSCATCHMPTDGWSVSAANIQTRFLLTDGLDPIFRTVDGSTCNHGIQVSTTAERKDAYSLLLTRGLLRIALDVPQNAEFRVINVRNPYGCGEFSPLSVYRRPLPAANLRFLTAVMWDGRESTAPSTISIHPGSNPADLLADLAHQALDAVNGHAEGTVPLTPQQQQQIANFEAGIYAAQADDFQAGSLTTGGAAGGPETLAAQPFFVGINDPLGQNPTGAAFSPEIFNLFANWTPHGRGNPASDRKASIMRGETLFNTKTIRITGVAGLNDATGLAEIDGTCGTCHDSPNVGNHSISVPLNIGAADVTNPLGIDYLPVITLQNIATGEVTQTTDPGRALVTGKWADIGKMKGPILRGLASRAPYFHNGSAATLEDVVEFYDKRFNIGLTDQEKADLAAFLSAL